MNTETTERKLTVRFPFELLDDLRTMARESNRSLNGEIIWLLRASIAQDKKQKEKQK